MVERCRPPSRIFQVGAAAAIAIVAPMTDLSLIAGAGPEKLSALREAAAAGSIELMTRASDGSLKPLDRDWVAQGGNFDRGAPFDKFDKS
jgi:hypothetical protein